MHTVRSKISAALAAAAAVAMLPVAPPVRAQAALVEHVGSLPAVNEGGPLDGALVLNPATRRGYQIRQFAPGGGSMLHVIDLDSLEPLGEIRLPKTVDSAPALRRDPHVAVDEEGGRLFIAYLKGPGDAGLAGVMVVDEATGSVEDQPLSPALTALGLKVAGMSYAASEDRLYFLVRNNTPPDPELAANQTVVSGLGTPRVFLLRWDPAAGTDDLLRFLRSCRALLPNENPTGHYQLPVIRSRFDNAVWVPCTNQQGGFQIVRVASDQLADPAGPEDVFPGPERVRDVLADPGSDRIIARYSATLGESWWVFDGRKRSWVGVIGASRSKDRPDYAAGMDDSTGRMYLHYPGIGLMMTDARRTPVPQALVFPQFEKGTSPMRIVTDPVTRRFFIRTASDRYDVFRDQEPAPPPPDPDADANTSDVPEQDGVTDVNFTGIAQGYGARALLVGGSFGVVPPGPGAEDARPVRALLNRTGTQCGPRDRELAFGVVEKTELGDSVANVRAHAARTDEATNQDLLAPSRCDLHPDAGPPIGSSFYPGVPAPAAAELDAAAREHVGWDTFFASAECSGNQAPDPRSSREVSSLRVRVSCDQSDAEASAEAGGPAIETDVVNVGTAFSRTRIFRDPRRGIVSQTYSIARGVNIGGSVTIEAVEAWAEAWANGRAKRDARADTASTRFVRRITGLTVRDGDGKVVFTCEDCSRDLIPAVQQANTALTGRAEVRIPMPDPVLLAGTPGGFQAAVQKDRFQKIADNSLNNDSSDEVPGLEVLSINDSPELRARQVVQLAGVAAASSYGIFLLDAFDFSSLPVLPDAEALPPGAEVLADAETGVTVSEALTSEPPRLDEPSIAERIADVPRAVVDGAAYLIRNPVEGLLATAVWLVLALPVYAFVRRRSLLKSIAGTGR